MLKPPGGNCSMRSRTFVRGQSTARLAEAEGDVDASFASWPTRGLLGCVASPRSVRELFADALITRRLSALPSPACRDLAAHDPSLLPACSRATLRAPERSARIHGAAVPLGASRSSGALAHKAPGRGLSRAALAVFDGRKPAAGSCRIGEHLPVESTPAFLSPLVTGVARSNSARRR